MKFPDMPYTRPDFEETQAKLQSLLEQFKSATSAEECFAAYKEYDEFTQQIWSMFAIARIRYTLDTTNEFYDNEKNFMDEVGPKLQATLQSFTQALLETPF